MLRYPFRSGHDSPKSLVDTWYAKGMEGTGSKDVAVTDLFVPERRALPMQRCRGGAGHPGGALDPGPLYRIPIVAASSHPLAPADAEGAYELFVASMAKRAGTYTGAKVLTSRPCRSRWPAHAV